MNTLITIKQVLKIWKCNKCGNKVGYDDTPYFKQKKLKTYEIGCPICGKRYYVDKKLLEGANDITMIREVLDKE